MYPDGPNREIDMSPLLRRACPELVEGGLGGLGCHAERSEGSVFCVVARFIERFLKSPINGAITFGIWSFEVMQIHLL